MLYGRHERKLALLPFSFRSPACGHVHGAGGVMGMEDEELREPIQGWHESVPLYAGHPRLHPAHPRRLRGDGVGLGVGSCLPTDQAIWHRRLHQHDFHGRRGRDQCCSGHSRHGHCLGLLRMGVP